MVHAAGVPLLFCHRKSLWPSALKSVEAGWCGPITVGPVTLTLYVPV